MITYNCTSGETVIFENEEGLRPRELTVIFNVDREGHVLEHRDLRISLWEVHCRGTKEITSIGGVSSKIETMSGDNRDNFYSSLRN